MNLYRCHNRSSRGGTWIAADDEQEAARLFLAIGRARSIANVSVRECVRPWHSRMQAQQSLDTLLAGSIKGVAVLRLSQPPPRWEVYEIVAES